MSPDPVTSAMLLLEYRNEDTTSSGELSEIVTKLGDQMRLSGKALLEAT